MVGASPRYPVVHRINIRSFRPLQIGLRSHARSVSTYPALPKHMNQTIWCVCILPESGVDVAHASRFWLGTKADNDEIVIIKIVAKASELDLL